MRKSVFVKWRLKKHMNIHSSPDVQACHFFNNNKTCPYEDLGCMFAHMVSGMCKFGKFCNNRLCSFQHKHEHDIEKNFQCKECDKTLTTHNNLINHVETIHVRNESKIRDHLFPQKCPNCPKLIYCDSENERHYFEEYGACKYKKSTEYNNFNTKKKIIPQLWGPCDPVILLVICWLSL